MIQEEAEQFLNGKKLLIATPMYGGQCSGQYVAGLIQTIAFLGKLNVSVQWVSIHNESLIPRGRNELARQFLDETDADFMLFIDADIAFGPKAVAQIMSANKPINGALYPKKEVNWDAVKKAAHNGDIANLEKYAGAFVFNSDANANPVTDDVGCVEVRHLGTGFMMIRRDVLEQLKPEVATYRRSTVKVDGEYVEPIAYEFFATRIDDTGCYLSEDYDFCELARGRGISVWCNPFIQLGHWGSYLFEGDILKSGGRVLEGGEKDGNVAGSSVDGGAGGSGNGG
jgi:hypothetical protein